MAANCTKFNIFIPGITNAKFREIGTTAAYFRALAYTVNEVNSIPTLLPGISMGLTFTDPVNFSLWDTQTVAASTRMIDEFGEYGSTYPITTNRSLVASTCMGVKSCQGLYKLYAGFELPTVVYGSSSNELAPMLAHGLMVRSCYSQGKLAYGFSLVMKKLGWERLPIIRRKYEVGFVTDMRGLSINVPV